MINFIRRVKDEVFSLIVENKIFLLFFLIPFVLGIVLAIIYLINFKEVLTIKNLIDTCLYKYLKCEISLFAYLIRRFLLFLLFFICIFAFHCNKFTQFLTFALVLYYSYFICFNMGIVIICFGFFGFLYALIMYLVLGILYLLLLLIMALFCKQCKMSGNYLGSCKKGYPICCVLVGALLVLNIIEIILLPILSSTFIIIL